jgi:hypothetical protein
MLRISMVSLTYANKSKMVLEKLGYKAKIVHNVTAKGCEYILSVDAPKSTVIDVLKKHNIPVKALL